MPSALKSYPVAGISAEQVVYTAPASPATTSTLIGVLVCNNGDAGGQKVICRLHRGSSFYNVVRNAPIPVGDTWLPSGAEGKLVLMPGDELRVSVDVGTCDVITSMLEQTPDS